MQRNFIFLYFLICHMETLVQIPIVQLMYFCNLSNCSLPPLLSSRDILKIEFSTFSAALSLAQVVLLSSLSLDLTHKLFSFTFKVLQNLSSAIFRFFFSLKRPFPASDLASFCSHTFNFSYQFLPSCPLCWKETFYKCLQSHFTVSHFVSV